MNINLLPSKQCRLRNYRTGRTMKKPILRLACLSVFIALVLALMPMQVYAATVISVSPSNIVSGTSTVITVTGTGFDNTAEIQLDGTALGGTVFVSDTTLQVTIPSDVAVGSHIIRVAMSGGLADGSAQITVSAPSAFQRPQLVVSSSRTRGDVTRNSEFKLLVDLRNASTSTAYGVQAVFSSSDLAPLATGGVVAVGDIAAGSERTVQQSFLVTGEVYSQLIVSVDVSVTYYDESGTSYSDKFSLTLQTDNNAYSGVVYATATPTGIKSSQLVIPSYAVSINPLQPGEQFTLTMTVQNTGNAKANRITMIVGGGSGGGSTSGTPSPGGVSGGSGEFTNFAPVGASNVQSLGDLPSGAMIQAAQNLIVNVSTTPGAYPMRVTFSYLNDQNEVVNDEQVITLLVYSLPNVEVNFYRPPDPFFVGQPGMLPLQVVNVTRHASVLGNMKVTSESGLIENGTSLIGSLDAGGYFTLDSLFTPEQSGTQVLDVTIEYTDDFNQPRTLTRKVEIEVMEGMTEEPGFDPSMGGGEFPIVQEETLGQKAWRVVLGLLGLDSAPAASSEPIMPAPEEIVPQVKPATGKG